LDETVMPDFHSLDAADAAQVLLSGDRVVAPLDHGIDPTRPRKEALRRLLEALPWATIIATNHWVPTLLNLTTRHLELCVNAAVLICPGDSRRLPLTPLPYPTVILTDAPDAVRRHARAWSSLVMRRNPALAEAQNLRLALNMLRPA